MLLHLKKIALSVPPFNFDSTLKSELSDSPIRKTWDDFQALDSNFALALEPKVFKMAHL